MGFGVSHGAITVINAIPCGTGSTIGIALRTTATFTQGGSVKNIKILNDPTENVEMARICVDTTLRHIGKELQGWTLEVDSEIPVSRGLKSSSSACNAIISAVLEEFNFKMDIVEMIRMGVDCARSAGVTVTGAFDDACGCHLGGLVITNNENDTIVESRDFEEYDVVICVPEHKTRKQSISKEMFTSVREEMKKAISMVSEDPFNAMTLNGKLISSVLGGDDSIVEFALKNGAIAAGLSGTGPGIAIITEKGYGENLAELLGGSIITKTRGLSFEL